MQPSYWGGFESTKIHGSGRDILGTTQHIRRWKHDLDLLQSAGVRELRYSIPWHRIERRPGVFDWSWIDGPMHFMQRTGMKPTVDPLHHTSFPDWLDDGFASPRFPDLYERFIRKVVARYPWVENYTVFNEPLPTTLFCSHTGMWYPHQTGDASFVRMALNVGRAISQCTQAILELNPAARFIHVETCESHAALDKRSEKWAEHAMHRRYLMHDLILGRISSSHPLYEYFVGNGTTKHQLRWFQDHPARIDVLGLDYYMHSEMEWYWDESLGRANISWPCQNPRGFRAVAQEYVDRYRVPVMLSETNIRGTFTDRTTWLKFMAEQTKQLGESGVDVRGFCWYPTIDSTDWCHCCTKSTLSVDPQGIWGTDANRWVRIGSVLSDTYAQLARGIMQPDEIPAFLFEEPLANDLEGYLKLMRHWNRWEEPERDRRVA